MTKMFPFITDKRNPIAGECRHRCVYCYSQAFIELYPNLKEKYSGVARLDGNVFKKPFKKGGFVFLQDMSDLFAYNVPLHLIFKIFNVARNNPSTSFLLLTKDPYRYLFLEGKIPANCVLGATVETDLHVFKGSTTYRLYSDISHAPKPGLRLDAMVKVKQIFPDHRLFLSVEPVLKFSKGFASRLLDVNPGFVAVGYDNYGFHLPEPSLSETLRLISILEGAGVKVYRKSVRKAWDEAG